MRDRTVPFNDLTIGDPGLASDIERALRRVVASSRFVLGPEVEAFEEAFRRVLGADHGVGVASGTDALSLVLMALGVGAGDEVITSPLTAAYTALAISRVGARPVFADVDEDTLTLSPESVDEHASARTRAIVPVHLYGNACDMDAITAIGERRGVSVVEDVCQAHGGWFGNEPLGSVGHAGAFSFYPTKNLGALGDGGFVATSDGELAERVRRLRNGGQTSRYVHAAVGINSRLDEIQAAVLRAKLPHLERWNERRRAIAARYESALEGSDLTPVKVRDGTTSARHLFVVSVPSRDAVMERLDARGIQTLIHYPIPVHLQPAYRDLGQGEGSCPVAEAAAKRILSLPLHPKMTDADVDVVIEALMAEA